MRINSKEQLQVLNHFFEKQLAQTYLDRKKLNAKLEALHQKLQNCSSLQVLANNHDYITLRRSTQIDKKCQLAEQESILLDELSELGRQELSINQTLAECLLQLGELKKNTSELKQLQENKHLIEQYSLKIIARKENEISFSGVEMHQQAEQIFSLQELKQELKLNFNKQVSNFIIQTQAGQNSLSFSFYNNANISFIVQVSLSNNYFLQLQIRPDDKKQFFPKDVERELLEILKKRQSLKFSITV